MATLGIQELLALRGFDSKRRTKLVRHQDSRYDVHDLLRRGWLEAYQSYQKRPVFDGVDFVVSFLGVGRTRARLLGVYRVLERRSAKDMKLPPGCPHAEWNSLPYFYQLERQPGFEDLERRVVIEWGKAALAWHQWLSDKDKEVLEILPKGQVRPLFRDYLEFTLTHSELKDLCTNEDKEWRVRLSAVAGVYLILATTTGAQYIGSAYGTDGIWGRWSAYARDGHGGNRLLRDLLASDASYPEAFSYSVLQILSTSLGSAEVLKWEAHYKEKLGSRAIGLGLNAN